ncbi:MAG: hypothetical protein ACR2P5_02280 [Gammaproteobacteria bacterium]
MHDDNLVQFYPVTGWHLAYQEVAPKGTYKEVEKSGVQPATYLTRPIAGWGLFEDDAGERTVRAVFPNSNVDYWWLTNLREAKHWDGLMTNAVILHESDARYARIQAGLTIFDWQTDWSEREAELKAINSLLNQECDGDES